MTRRSSVVSSPIIESPSFVERSTLTWGALLIGVVIGFVAVYVVVAQPIFAQLESMQKQLVAMQDEMRTLVGVRDEAWEAGNLLSDLKSLRTQVADARGTVREIRHLRNDLLVEAGKTGDVMAAVGSLGRIQDELIERRELAAPASRSLDQLAQIQQRLIHEQGMIPHAEGAVANLEQTRRDLSDLVALKQQLAESLAGLGAAKSAVENLLSLKDQILAQPGSIETARTHVNRLFLLQEELNSHSEDMTAAFASLDRLMEIKDKLLDQTPRIGDAMQNLELLADFQHELDQQIRGLAQMREGLMQFVMLETTVGRVARMLEPLSQIANVRRLSDQELREAARSILENRATRITSKPDVPRRIPDPIEEDEARPTDPFNLPQEEENYIEASPGLTKVPDPLPIPDDEPADVTDE